MTANDVARRNVNVARRLLGVSAERLAECMGYRSRQVVSDRLGGRTALSVDDLVAFARALDVSPAALLDDDPAVVLGEVIGRLVDDE